MKKDSIFYRVEFGFADNFFAVNEWDTIDELTEVTAENAEEAAKDAACIDGLENALFRVYKLVRNEFEQLEKSGEPEYFSF